MVQLQNMHSTSSRDSSVGRYVGKELVEVAQLSKLLSAHTSSKAQGDPGQVPSASFRPSARSQIYTPALIDFSNMVMGQSQEAGPAGEQDSSKAATRKDVNVQYIHTGPIGAASSAPPTTVLQTVAPASKEEPYQVHTQFKNSTAVSKR